MNRTDLVNAQVLPLLDTLTEDSATEVRAATIEAILQVVQYLSQSTVVSVLLPLCKRLISHDNSEVRSTGCELLFRLTVWIDDANAASVVASELPNLCLDTAFRVRKACAQFMCELCTRLSPVRVESEILPQFDKLSLDPIWSVRQAAVIGLRRLLPHVTSRSARETVLIPLMKRSCRDASRWVRHQAHVELGPFLFGLEIGQIDSELVERFVTIPSSSDDNIDTDANYECAYAFPAVIARLGPQRWKQVANAYFSLCRDPKFKVRRSLAYSLHEVALVLGPDITDRDLLMTFELFFKDLDEVRTGIIANIAQLFAAMHPSRRLLYIDVLWDIQREANHNWRLRYTLATQLLPLCRLYPIDVLCTTILPLALSLIDDHVAEVRLCAVQSVGPLLSVCRISPDAHLELLNECLALASSDSCQKRQLYAWLCASLCKTMLSVEFEAHFLAPLCALARDRVYNVRCCVLHVLRSIYDGHRLSNTATGDAMVRLALDLLDNQLQLKVNASASGKGSALLDSIAQFALESTESSPTLQIPLAIEGITPVQSPVSTGEDESKGLLDLSRSQQNAIARIAI
jgi:serine/threonine-protein phosphatase 4 regulatory subunit 1